MDRVTCLICGEEYRQKRGKAWACSTSEVCKKFLMMILEVERREKQIDGIVNRSASRKALSKA